MKHETPEAYNATELRELFMQRQQAKRFVVLPDVDPVEYQHVQQFAT